MEATIPLEEGTVAATAEHQIGIEFAPEFGPGFGEDPGEVDDPVEFVTESGDVIPSQVSVAGFSLHHYLEIVPADRGDQQGGGWRGGGFLTEVLHEIEEFARLVADFREQGGILRGAVIAGEVGVARAVAIHAAVEEIEKAVIPSHTALTLAGHGRGASLPGA